MALNIEKLQTILRKGDARAVATFFRGSSESDRRAAAKVTIDWGKFLQLHWRAQFNKKAREELEKRDSIAAWHYLPGAAYLAVLATGNFGEVEAMGFLGRGEISAEEIVAVLDDRRPEWMDDFADFLAREELGRWSGAWRIIRPMVAPAYVARQSTTTTSLARSMASGPATTQTNQGPS